SQALVPAQRISNGAVRLTVVEGFIDRIILKDGSGAPEQDTLIRDMAQGITASKPLRSRDLERALLLINDLPGVSASAYLEASKTVPGAADLVLVVERKSIDALASIDNRGTRFLGPYQGTLQGSINNALGLDDRTSIRLINTVPFRDLHYGDIDHEEQLGSDGAKLGLGFFYSDAHPEHNQGLHDQDYSGSLQLAYPLIRSRAENLSLRARFELSDFKASNGGGTLSEDKLLVGRFQGSYDLTDIWVRLPATDLALIEVSQGVPGGPASRKGSDLSRAGAEPGFTKVAGTLSREQSLVFGFSVLAAGAWQYSGDVVPASEEFGFGGTEFGRGYDPSEILGDSGVAGKLELRWGQAPGLAWFTSYQLYGFYDVGAVWANQNLFGFSQELTAASTGVGARVTINTHLSGYVELGVPLTRTVAAEGNRDPRVFFGITGRF
ncbi:MAG TPA: ShlB/FhaC/HecB family hemolysin secretion/activation protein, partial [Stellaceae bacterium]|nr:ShlB/FhaC/HecB family hemolysin secretion/activation protein [Stellaceae bacterium]